MKKELLDLIEAYAKAKSMADCFTGCETPEIDEGLTVIWQQIESRIDELVGN